jgi:hypothetical protein
MYRDMSLLLHLIGAEAPTRVKKLKSDTQPYSFSARSNGRLKNQTENTGTSYFLNLLSFSGELSKCIFPKRVFMKITQL